MASQPSNEQLAKLAVLYVYAHVHRLEPETSHPDSALQELLTQKFQAQGSDVAAVKGVFDYAQAAQNVISSDEPRTMSAVSYDKWRAKLIRHLPNAGSAGYSIWPPTSQTISVHLGKGNWNHAIEVAGIPQSTRGRALGTSRFTSDDYRKSLVAFCKAKPDDTSFRSYVEWVKEQRAVGIEHPAGATVRKAFGSWNAAKASAGCKEEERELASVGH